MTPLDPLQAEGTRALDGVRGWFRLAQQEMQALRERAVKAEAECERLQTEMSRLQWALKERG